MVADDSSARLGDLISDAKAYLAMCIVAEGGSRAESLDDLIFLSGKQWPVNIQRQRDIEERPCLTVNKLPTFLHQVTNDQRQNVPSIKVSPVDSNADIKTAEVFQGLIRHIEYSSNADVAYDTAVNSAAAIGFGYFALRTDFCSPRSFDQEIKFRRIRNSFTVYFDPNSIEADGSDARRCMITTRMPTSEFKREFPNAQVPGADGFQVGPGDSTNRDWFGADFVRVAEYYRIEEDPATLVELTNGEVGYKDELLSMPEGVTIKRERESTRPKVMFYKLSALGPLEEPVEIKCRWIPVFPVYGDELDIDGKVQRSGIIRNAKDPAKMYNFWMTCATEEVALRPKTPYIGAEGQFEGYEDDWNSANTKSYSYLEYKLVELNGNLAPAPQRQPTADIPQGMLTMAMHANDNIKATTGLFDSSLGALGNARSGVQERSQQRQGDMANFHFADNLNRSVRHAARCLVSMAPHYYDGARIIRIMGEDNKISSVAINQPAPKPTPDPNAPAQSLAPPVAPVQPGAPLGPYGQGDAPPIDQVAQADKILHDLTVGEYDITVKAGPSYSTLREEAADSMIKVAGSWPKLMDIAGDEVIRVMDWPGADRIANRVAKSIPPELRGDDEGNSPPAVVNTPKGPIPVEQASQMLVEMDQQIQQMGQALQEAQSGLDKAKLDNQTKLQQAQISADSAARVAEINAVSRSDVEELKGLVQLLVAKIQPPPALAAEALTEGQT